MFLPFEKRDPVWIPAFAGKDKIDLKWGITTRVSLVNQLALPLDLP